MKLTWVFINVNLGEKKPHNSYFQLTSRYTEIELYLKIYFSWTKTRPDKRMMDMVDTLGREVKACV